MDSYYTYGNFFQILSSAAALTALVITGVRNGFESRDRRYGNGCLMLLILFLTAHSLEPVCPYPFPKRILILLPRLLVLPAVILLYIRSRGNRTDNLPGRISARLFPVLTGSVMAGILLTSPPWTPLLILLTGILVPAGITLTARTDRKFGVYRSWIIDTLRETIIVFDPELRVISSGREMFPPGSIRTGRPIRFPEEGKEDRLKDLQETLKGKSGGQGAMRYAGRIYHYRFRPLNNRKGFILTLLDITQEQLLIDELQNKNRLLTSRRTILQAGEDLQLNRERERMRQQITREIQNLVQRKLSALQGCLTGTSGIRRDLKEIIGTAEESMTEIRRAVSELSPEKDGI